MRIIYVDGTESNFGDDVTYDIFDSITVFYRIIKKKPHGFLAKIIGENSERSKLMTVYNSQIKAILP